MSIKSTIIAFLSLFIITLFSASCKKVCKTCDYGTACNNGYCFCPNGLEGDSCHTYSYLKFINLNYIASDPCSGISNYSVYITGDGTYANKIYINNMFGSYTIEADIYSNATKQGVDLIIPDNSNNSQGAFQVSGSGLYQIYGGRARITLNLDYVSGGLDKQCTVILTQQ